MNQQSVSIMQGLGTTDEDVLVFNDAILDVQPQMMQMQRQFEEVMLEAVNTDPALNEQIIRLMTLRSAVENYESPRQQRRRERQESRAQEDD
ncbi:MAG: hypothetical protein PVH89_04525 [Gammaproteobacteria bacterium]